MRAQTNIDLNARTGVRAGRVSYHLVEVSRTENRVILPHIGYLDFADLKNYYEIFAGGGYKLIQKEKFELSGEMFVLQTSGARSEHAHFLQPSAEAEYEISEKLRSEAAGFAYLPFGGAGRTQVVLEHAKLEYVVGPRFKFGGGYGSYQVEGDEWKESPFVSATITPQFGKYGSFEVWLQKVERSSQLQIRYRINFGEEK